MVGTSIATFIIKVILAIERSCRALENSLQANMPQYPITDPALRWLEVIFSERYGHAWHLSRSNEGLRLQLAGAEGAILFDTIEDGFTKAHSDQPYTWWDASSEGWHSVLGGLLPAPGVAELLAPVIETRAGEHVIHYDIPGLSYWMLARVEEIGRTDLDNHCRFPATASHANQHDYLERPVVDEWLHILGQVMQRQWPAIQLVEHYFSTKVSHDVDNPSLYGFKNWLMILRGMAGDVLRRHDLKHASLAPWVRINTKDQLHPRDPANTFDWIMDVSEAHGLTSAFYFICGRTVSDLDADYEPEHPAIRALMRRIHQRGHEIGLHPSYGTYQSPDLLKAEANRLRRIAGEEGIEQAAWGGRMHYLRWEHPTTLRAWNGAGMAYDSSLGYADRPGFRCGTCFEYPAFDPTTDKFLSLRIRPLIAMETTILAPHYLGLGTGELAFEKFEQLKRSCQAVRGCFTLLWHNCQFEKQEERRLYQKLLATYLAPDRVTPTDFESDAQRIQ